jgi:hypothetical protein
LTIAFRSDTGDSPRWRPSTLAEGWFAVAIETSAPAFAHIRDRLRFASLMFTARLLAVVVLAASSRATASSPAPLDKASAEPADLSALVGRARSLPPLAADVRANLERRYPSWRSELIGFDLRKKTEAVAQQSESSAIDLAEALRKAKPAPMASPSQSRSSRSGHSGETLDKHAMPDSGSPRASPPEQEAPNPSPGDEHVPRRSDSSPGDGASRASQRGAIASPGSYHVLALYIVDGEEFSFFCEATRLGHDELLTAGHCVYQRDPNGDGDAGDARWATRAWVWPVGPEPSAALPVSRLAAHQEWITRGAPEHDVGVVTVPALLPVPSPEDSVSDQ